MAVKWTRISTTLQAVSHCAKISMFIYLTFKKNITIWSNLGEVDNGCDILGCNGPISCTSMWFWLDSNKMFSLTYVVLVPYNWIYVYLIFFCFQMAKKKLNAKIWLNAFLVQFTMLFLQMWKLPYNDFAAHSSPSLVT